MRTEFSLGLAVFFAWALGAANVATAEPAHLTYSAPDDCPDAASFLREVSSRTHTNEIAEDGPFGRTLTVTVTPGSGVLVGTLEWTDHGDSAANRRVEARGCADVLSALALMAALILEPETAASSAAVSPDLARPESTMPALPDRPGGRLAAPLELRNRPASPASLASNAIPSKSASSSALQVGAQSTVSFLVLPRTLLGVGAMADWTGRVWGVWRAEARVGVGVGTTGSVETTSSVGGGSSAYRVLSGSLDVCPARVSLPIGLGLAPHVGVQLGSLWAEGQGPLVLAASSQLLWLVAGAGLRIGYDVGARMSLELDTQALWPLGRYRFHFDDPTIPIYGQPTLGMMSSLGFAYRVW